jgi:DNA-binding FadR family transcriptional regulator
MIHMEPIDHRTVADAVRHRLLELLRSGNLKAGDQLPTEQQIMEDLGVSRPPVREALHALAGMGLVEKRQGSGHFVRAVRLNHILESEAAAFLDVSEYVAEIVEARMFLEVEIIAKVTRLAGDETRQALRACLTQMQTAFEAGDYTPRDSAEFHICLARLAGNRVLPHLIDFLNRLSLQTEEALLSAYFDPALDLARHQQLLEVIEGGDAERARQAMRAHISTALERARIAGPHAPASPPAL